MVGVIHNYGVAIKDISLLVVFCLVIIHATAGETSMSRDEYLKLKRKLKDLTIPGVISIKTKNGDTFDCVDIYKQPALHHPLLKNHTIQMRPNSFPEGMRNEVSSYTLTHIGLKNGGCPLGIVPIRGRMKDLSKATSLSILDKNYPKKADGLIHRYATIETRHGQFYGTQANMNVWAPIGDKKAFNLSQFWVTNGFGPKLNTIEAGWVVDPVSYGDNLTRLFSFWTRDNYRRTGCKNLRCPGFVQISREIPLEISIEPLSTYNGPQYDIVLSTFKDKKTGDWWLVFGNNKVMGYWPKSIFTNFGGSAERIVWGGEVAYPRGTTSPPMGSGHLPNEGFGKSCFEKKIMVVDNSYRVTNFTMDAILNEEQNCYGVIDSGNLGGDFGRVIFFGGPGHC